MPNLASRLAARVEPVRIGLIGAGKFGSMFLAQARRTAGLHVVGVADVSVENAKASLSRVGWPVEQFSAASLEAALGSIDHATAVIDNADALLRCEGLDVIIEATGSPYAGVRHASMAIEHGKHLVMVNVETDALVGPLLAERASAAGVIYSLAYGDQPALIAEQVDWARAIGLEVVAAGKGTKYLPEYHSSTPDTIWNHYGITAEEAAQGGMNPQMFNSFLDGTKSAIESAATSNATGLLPPANGLLFPPADVDALPEVLRPVADGGVLAQRGMVEVVSSMRRDGTALERDLRWGVYTCFAAPDDYVARCFGEYGLRTDSSGIYAAMYKPYHLIGLELGFSVASVAVRGEPTGAPTAFRADVVAVAKRDLVAGETLDGEGGYTVWGKLAPAQASLSMGALPLGLAHGVVLKRAVACGEVVRYADVTLDAALPAVALRREMEQRERVSPSH